MGDIKTIIGWVCIFICVAIAVIALFIKFSNPELTQTQLFYKLWWSIPLMLISLFGMKKGFE